MDDIVRKRIDVINQRIKELNALYHAAANCAGVSDGEVSLWSALLTSEEYYSQQDLSEMLSLPKQTVNSLVVSMVKKGFVRLEHAPGSRNRKVIHLTDTGRIFGTEKVLWIFQAEQRAMEDTDPQDALACISMLEGYIQRFRMELERAQQSES